MKQQTTYCENKKQGIKLSIISAIMCLSEETAEMTRNMIADIREEMKDRSDIEFIIVDNASTFGIEDMKNDADIYIRLPKNAGWGGGLNVGMKVASGDFFLFANNDIRITIGWVDLLLERFASNIKIGTISIHWPGGFSGSFFAIRKEIYEKIGGFDEIYFPLGHAQDCDYLYRLMSEGWDDNVLKYEGFTHFGRRTYNQDSFYKEYNQHPNFGTSDFVGKWGFEGWEWEVRGHKDWGTKILADNSLDRFGDLDKMRRADMNI